MKLIIAQRQHSFNWIAWVLLALLLLAISIASTFTLFSSHAAPAPDAVINGSYALRATTTSGPQKGLYITGILGLTVSQATITGVARGLSYAHSSEYAKVTGSTPDNIHVALTINAIPHVKKIGAITLAGIFQMNSGHKGSFTGFKGTYSFGTGSNTSSGTWEAILETSPTANGTWHVYLVVLNGLNKGTTYHGVLTLTQGSGSKITGTFCPTHGSCIPVKGTNRYGFVLLDLGSPASFVLRGIFTTSPPGFNGRMNGKFYLPGRGSGKHNDRGYWVAND
jgi:hypothetical protein